ncbi:aminotransferase class V-fold PLP-dependent enzyme [Prevotella bivia]|uniref:Probable cysteine desulfurase n=1 Tax=Prevotella bivia DSM 20514 TaxID=868129 RepID=I4Z8N8_9BACT|nr:cysteine desulfurase [Prevotella bivia]EFB93367.1 cysteine desulfurase, SufS subfamily [Prevotella bivia JCVIHMP010]EIM32580.1 cysteine desulfurase-like protein, SufS subfamily [Prevotella bivia DSM 20514]KXU59880.1 cysteine desulfurase, SufS subfamily [Prevotella bivia]
MYDINKVRADFPILSRTIYGKPLVYLDNGATTQKPLSVLNAMRDEYLNVNANVHRGVHWLSQQATDLHEAARETVRKFLNARSTSEIVFTRGTTESLNLIASSFTDGFLKAGDEVIISTMEHHSNIVPWQLQAAKKGIALKVIPLTENEELDIEAYANLFSTHTKLVSVTHVSNVLGTINPIKEMIRMAHDHGVPVMIDGAQSVPHFKVDVQELDCEFLAFSGHKVYGPTGIGVLYGKEEWLDKLPPYQGGGEMIEHVSFEKTTFERPPLKFEAGTPDYVATHGLAIALDYVSALGMDNIFAHEQALTHYALQQLREIEGIHIYGHAANRGDAVISFNVDNIHPMDIGTLLDQLGIAVRTGHHCAQPLIETLGTLGTVRASFGLYNTKEEIDILTNGLKRVVKMF